MRQMDENACRRTISELESKSVKWWPASLTNMESSTSIIPKLLETLDDFLSVLKLSKDTPDQVFDVLNASSLAGNVFLKHLCVLADVGGEHLMRVNRDFDTLFEREAGNLVFRYIWKGNEYSYVFQGMPRSGSLNNNKLRIDGKSLVTPSNLTPTSKDIAMLLLHGAASTDARLGEETLSKCQIGAILGNADEIEQYARSKYIHVSRITNGATSNTLGQVAQRYVKDFLCIELGRDYDITGHVIALPNGTTEVFDIVVTKGEKCVGIEVSFQVTTNSTIERKAKQASLRHRLLRSEGHFVAYVIDGAGNFQRSSAITAICSNSDCTVAYSDSEFRVLSNFIKSVL